MVGHEWVVGYVWVVGVGMDARVWVVCVWGGGHEWLVGCVGVGVWVSGGA